MIVGGYFRIICGVVFVGGVVRGIGVVLFGEGGKKVGVYEVGILEYMGRRIRLCLGVLV